MRLKSREQDLVNMFLTGFDATTLNTLFVFSSILRLENILTPFDEFHAEELLSPVKGRATAVSTWTFTRSDAQGSKWTKNPLRTTWSFS